MNDRPTCCWTHCDNPQGSGTWTEINGEALPVCEDHWYGNLDRERRELRAEVDLLRSIVLFADGYVVQSSRQYEMFTVGLADLYNDTCDEAAALVRAGCYPRGSFKDDAPAHTRQDDETCSCGSESFERCLRAVLSGLDVAR